MHEDMNDEKRFFYEHGFAQRHGDDSLSALDLFSCWDMKAAGGYFEEMVGVGCYGEVR